MSETKGIMAGRHGFMPEHKPGNPDAFDQRLLNHERLRNEQLAEKLAEVVDDLAEATILVIELRSRNTKLRANLKTLADAALKYLGGPLQGRRRDRLTEALKLPNVQIVLGLKEEKRVKETP